MNISRDELDSLFTSLNNEDVNRDLRKEVRALLAVAEKSEAFKALAQGFFMRFAESITIVGVVPKPMMAAMLSMFVLGYNYALTGKSTGAPERLPAPEIPMTEEEMERLRKEIRGEDK